MIDFYHNEPGEQCLWFDDSCHLKRKEVDWNEGRALIIGKGDQEAVVRFSERALAAMKHYLNERSPFDQRSGRQLPTLPVFTDHGPNNQKKVAG